MRKHLLLLLAVLCVSALSMSAQVFTTSPAPLQEDSKNVAITFHADKAGVGGLMGLPAGTSLYAHIGVYTTQSPSTWSHEKTTWGVNTPETEFKYKDVDTYELTIGDLRTYFGITDPAETITKVCVLTRNGASNVQTKDYFIDVLPGGFQAALTCSSESYVLTAPASMTFTMATTRPADIKISVDNTTIASASDATSASGSFNFSEAGGMWNVVATATASGETITKKIEIAYPLESPQANYPGGVPKQGAVRNADGSVTFCLAAPGKTNVMLVGSWDNYAALNRNVMSYQDYEGHRYFWLTVTGLEDSTPYPYYYLVDGTTKVGDPYTHLVLDCYSDKWLNDDVFPDRPAYPYDILDDTQLAVYQSDIDDYDWQVKDFEIPSHENLLIYELLFRDFTGSDATDDGTVRKAIEKIPYLKELGINAVELMPVMEFNGNNSWGYNTNFYMAPDKSYGSPDDYKEFIDECHRNGIAVILDVVFNQSDGLNPRYQMYPIDANPFYNASAPHAYSVLNDWKQDHPLVKQHWVDVITYWMTAYNVDGFRFDLVKGLGDNASYGGDTEKYNQSRIDNMKALHAAIKAVKPNGIHINENLAGAAEENAMAADGQLNWANKNYAASQYAMGFADGNNLEVFLSTKDDNRAWGSTVAYAESHDEQRVGYKQLTYGAGSGSASLKRSEANRCKRQGSMAAQIIMTPGPKMIWMFGELGAEENTKGENNSNLTDPKKVLWGELEKADRKALHDNYGQLMWFRRDNPELFTPSATFDCVNFQNSISVNRTMRLTDGNKEAIVFINTSLSNSPATITATASLLNASNANLISHTTGCSPVLTDAGAGKVSVSIPGHSFAMFATVPASTGEVGGVDDVWSDSSATASVYGGVGEIIVDGDYSTIAVHDISGRSYGSLRVAPGIYIVTIDGIATTKVLVR